MTDLSQMSDADLLAAYQAAKPPENPLAGISDADLMAMHRANTPVTATDRAHAAEGGVLSGLAYGVTSPLDAVANLGKLAEAGYGSVRSLFTDNSQPLTKGHYDPVTGKGVIEPTGATHYAPPDIGSAFPVGRALTGLMDKSDLTSTQAPRPDDTLSRYLNTAGQVAGGSVVGGGSLPAIARSTAVATPGAIAGRYVAEAKPFQSDTANNAASILTQVLGTSAVGAATRPRGELLPENEIKNDAVTKGQELGAQFPPATTNPTAINRLRENIAGKTTTAQNMAINNQAVTNEAARSDMGLPAGKGGAITDLEIQTAKSQAAPGYDALRTAGKIIPPKDFAKQLDAAMAKQSGAGSLATGLSDQSLGKIVTQLKKNPSFDAGNAMDAIAALRDKASTAYRNGEAQAGAAYKGVSRVLEDAIESHLNKTGQSDLINDFKDSRRQFAIINSVEDNRNSATGNVVATKLAAALKKGDYLSGDLQTMGKSAAQAPAAFSEPTKTAGNHLGLWGSVAGGLLAAKEAHELLPEQLQHAGLVGALAAGSIPLARAGTRMYIQGPGQSNALPRSTVPILDPNLLGGAYAAGASNANR